MKRPATFSRFNLPRLCSQLARSDRGLAALLAHYGPPPFWSRPEGFATLVQIILEQQVSLASAAACYGRLRERLGEVLPEAILLLTDEELHAASVSRQKASYLRALANAVLSGSLDIEALRNLDDDAVIAALTAVKGIGRWTADVYLMMVLHRCDRFPMGDVALLQSMREHLYDGGKADAETLAGRAEQWRPYRSAAAFLLWHAYLQKRGRPYPL